MRVIPRSLVKKISFCEARIDAWQANAGAIGVDEAEVDEVAAKTAAARAAYDAQQQALLAAQAMTLAFNAAVEGMSSAAAALILKVRAKASTAGNDVYALALIPQPENGSPIGAPGTPRGFTVQLQQVGSLLLRWKCANPKGSVGTMYQVSRQIGAAEFEHLAVVGEKQFLDETIPAGTASVTYEVRAVRSTARGESARFSVNFGGTGRVRANRQAA